MALTYSQPMAVGTKAPSFQLPDTISGKMLSLEDVASPKGTVVMFICNHCPYVKHINHKLAEMAKEYTAKGMSFVAISANDVANYPQDGPEHMKEHAAKMDYCFPYLYDESQQVAKSYDAQCTPEFYVFDKALQCVYHGRFDDSSPGKPNPVTGNDLRAALDATLVGKPAPDAYPSMGCNIKWR